MEASPEDPIQQGEQPVIDERRRQAGQDANGPRIGLALSGGGIRSATFCLGLLRGLAKNGLLPRFDYLSTVSGGGYVGAALGRLIDRLGIHGAQAELARGKSPTLDWLRRNGRYLMPSGVRDYGIAIATYMRAGIAIHLELGALCILAALAIVLPHALQFQLNVLDPPQWWPWQTVWWPMAVGWWLLTAPGAMAAYWAVRDPSINQTPRSAGKGMIAGADVAVLVFVLVTLVVLIFYPWQCLNYDEQKVVACTLPVYFERPLQSGELRVALLLVFASVAVRTSINFARLSAAAKRNEPASVVRSERRNALTMSVRMANLIAGTMLLLGLLDLVSWELKEAFDKGTAWLLGGIGLGTVLVTFGRSFLEPLKKLTATGNGKQIVPLSLITNILGIVAGLLIVIGWTTLVQWLVFADDSQDAPAWLNEMTALGRIGVVAALPLLWIGLTFRNVETINASSLHGFYRGRLIRAYLRVGNPDFAKPDSGALNVSEVVKGDDIELCAYAPHRRGGPLHVISTCLNQTRSSHGDVYNADRKGHRLAASALALELESGNPLARTAQEHGTLGHWVAMSGAAAAPGAGSYTSMGWSLLLFLTGVRLGYWYPRAGTPVPHRGGWAGFKRWFRASKYYRLASEALAHFKGVGEPAWYVSDGGHFENTGVHALLRRELDFILLADCGADPQFELNDLENLIRKARIDYDARIEFYSRDAIWRHLNLPGDDLSVLSPADLSHNYSARGVLLARITYRRGSDDPDQWRYGTLLVVKPNLHQALDADLLGYARRNPGFPQQSTGDQFFDEAQWESYHRLGEDFGEAMTPAWMAQMPGWNQLVDADKHRECVIRTTSPFKPNYAEGEPAWRAGAKAAAIGATLGLSALGAIALPAWQIYDQVWSNYQTNAAQLSQARKQTFRGVPWALASRLPTPEERSKPISADTLQSVSKLYSSLRSFSWRDGARRPDIRALLAIQDACSVKRQGPDVAQRCPTKKSSSDLGEVCQNVCDADRDYDPYWILPNRKAQSESVDTIPAAVPVTVAGKGTQGSPQTHASPITGAAIGTLGKGGTTSMDRPPQAATSPTPDAKQAAIEAALAQAQRLAALSKDAVAACRVAGTSEYARVTLYVQVYDQQSKLIAQSVQWDNAGVQMPGVEDVTAKALAANRRAPFVWPQPTLVVHRGEETECAKQLGSWLATQLPQFYDASSTHSSIDIRKLPDSYKSRSPIIELWLPPATVKPASATRPPAKAKNATPPSAASATATKTADRK